MNTVLVPVDFSETAPLVLGVAERLAKLTGSRVHLLHVVQPLAEVVAFEPGMVGAVAYPGEPPVDAQRKRLETMAGGLADEGIDATASVVTGPVAEAVLEAADRESADWIVMGSHGHGALYHLLVGSATEAVLRRALCPVVVVPGTGRR